MGSCYSFVNNIILDNELKKLDDTIELFDLKGMEYNAKVVDVYDGDTCTIVIRLNNNWTKFKLRALGYDTPEMKPSKDINNRDELINMAIKSRNYYTSRITNCDIDLAKHYNKKEMKELLKNNTKLVKVKSYGWDKYGRFLGEIFVDQVNINEEMIDKQYAYRYDGGTKKTFDIKI